MNSVEATRLALVDHDLAGKSSVERTKALLHDTADLGDQVEQKVRRVRTPAGSRRYGQPIGTIITRDMIKRAKRRRGGTAGSGGGNGETRRGPNQSGGGGSGGGSNRNNRRRGGRDRNGNGGNGGNGGPDGGGLPGGLLGRLFSGDKPKKPRKGRKGRKRRGRNPGSGGSGPGSGGSGSGGRGRSGSGGSGSASNGQYGSGSNGRDPLGEGVDRGSRDSLGKKSLPSVEATRESFWAAVEKGLDLGVESKVGSLYFFEGRNTGVSARSASEARKLKKRGGDRIVAVRKPDSTERRAMQQGRWVRTRRDGKSPGQSQYGKGRGQGPPRS